MRVARSRAAGLARAVWLWSSITGGGESALVLVWEGGRVLGVEVRMKACAVRTPVWLCVCVCVCNACRCSG